MKLSIKEAMKFISRLEDELNDVLSYEKRESYIVYLEREQKEETDYNFLEVSEELTDLRNKIRSVKNKINIANFNTTIEYDNLTIAEALILLAQLNSNYSRLSRLSSNKQITRRTTYDASIEYTEMLYDVNKVRKLAQEELEKIHLLQTAIDKANILTTIEV